MNRVKENELVVLIDQLKKEQSQVGHALSHDIKESIRNVNSFLKLIHLKYHGRLDHGMTNYLKLITNSTERMEGLVDDMSRLNKLGQRFEKEEVCIQSIVNNVVRELSVEINYSKARISFTNLPTLFCDKESIYYLFKILIQNALKYRKEGQSPEIKITAMSAYDLTEFSIEDNGIGIDPKFAQAIFEIFRQLHPRGAYAGNGAGLTLAKKIVQLHNGTIWLETKNTLKTEFKFNLPNI